MGRGWLRLRSGGRVHERVACSSFHMRGGRLGSLHDVTLRRFDFSELVDDLLKGFVHRLQGLLGLAIALLRFLPYCPERFFERYEFRLMRLLAGFAGNWSRKCCITLLVVSSAACCARLRAWSKSW